MMYDTLAQYYDALVKDEAATAAWVNLIARYVPKGDVLELACGSGEITIQLAQQGYHLTGTDLSIQMLQEAQKKPGSEHIQWFEMDMCDFTVQRSYDGILCLCDSFNYLLKESQVLQLFQQAYDHLRPNGVFLMDMHAMDRLAEFREEYNEAGRIDTHDYQWMIQTIDACIAQTFAFYDETGRVTLEQHLQRVYDPIWIQQQLQAVGFQVDIFTDFDQPGICPGEKQFYICRKGNV